MPRVQLPAVTPKRKVWNKGRIVGQKRPLLPKQAGPSERDWNWQPTFVIWRYLTLPSTAN